MMEMRALRDWQEGSVMRVLAGLVVLGAGLTGAGCAEPVEEPMPYQATATMHEFMMWVLEPPADVIWDSAGFVVTIEGEVDLQPTTQEGWDHVRNSATQVAEAANLLMMPGYRADRGDWVEYAEGLQRAALAARTAADARDADALFDAGGQIYNVCRACHNKYIVRADP